MSENEILDLQKLLMPQGPICAVVTARLAPVGDTDRFQPAGFPEIGHVIYKRPSKEGAAENVCIVDSPASMANHLESVCLQSPNDVSSLHEDLTGLPYVACVTDDPQQTPRRRTVCTTLSEGHRLASDYFLDGQLLDPASGVPTGGKFAGKLRSEFGIREVDAGKKYFVYPDNWGSIFSTIFKYDPNSLVHGVFFAKEQIRISRFLTAHLEAFGASRVTRSGVKFDRLGKTTSGQPIFSVDEELATEIRATFILDLALLRSFGRGGQGLNDAQKLLLLELAFWKIARLISGPFRYRTQCMLAPTEPAKVAINESVYHLPVARITESIAACRFEQPLTEVFYPADDLFKAAVEKPEAASPKLDETLEEEESEG